MSDASWLAHEFRVSPFIPGFARGFLRLRRHNPMPVTSRHGSYASPSPASSSSRNVASGSSSLTSFPAT